MTSPNHTDYAKSCRNVSVDSIYVEVRLTQELVVAMMTSITIPAAGEVTQDVKMQDSNTNIDAHTGTATEKEYGDDHGPSSKET